MCVYLSPNELLRQLFFILVSNEVLFDSEICERKVFFERLCDQLAFCCFLDNLSNIKIKQHLETKGSTAGNVLFYTLISAQSCTISA